MYTNQLAKISIVADDSILIPFSDLSLFFIFFLSEGGQKHSEITQALIYMVCKDNLPLSCVEKKGLQKFCRTACPLYKLPCRKKVSILKIYFNLYYTNSDQC